MALTITHAKRERFNCQNAICHVVTRCNNQELLIKNKIDFTQYIAILKKCKDKHGFLLHNYSIMNNHVHLLIKLFATANISQIMHSINRWYARWFNEHYARKGHFWEDRFYGELVDNDYQLLAVMRYIDLNPVKAGLCKEAAEWPYSGAHLYLKGIKDDLLDTPEIYTSLSDTNAARQKTYSFLFPSILTRLE